MTFPKNPALEAAVIADAENDLPRLVYADWLDENGDPARAAFIRTQCALHDKNPADPDYPDLVEARREAFDAVQMRDDLEPKLPAAVDFHDTLSDPDEDDFQRSYHRGFPYLVGDPLDVRNEQKAADRFRAALPKVLATSTARGFHFGVELSTQLHRILPAEECGRFTTLLCANYTARGDSTTTADAVVRSPLRASVRWLGLDVSGDAEATTLAAAKLPNLRRWEAHHGFRCTPAGLKKLVSADWFGNLHRLLCPFPKAQGKTLWAALSGVPDLHTVHVWGWSNAGGLASLGTAKPFRSLGRLHLHSTRVSGPDLNGLVRARLPRLAVLEVNGSMRNDDLKTLVTADWFAGLRVLKLDCDELGEQGVVVLGQTPTAANLRSLALGTSKLRPRAFASLARDYPNLTTLDLSAIHSTKITAADVAVFAAGLSLPRLRHLNLHGWPLDDAGAVALAKNPAVAGLTWLNLESTKVGAKGVRAVLESPHTQRLTSLSLFCCNGGAGVEALADPGVLPGLVHCYLPNRVPKAVYEKLVSARGNIFVGGPG